MVNTSKILTVSYGTFSCTLEGFDDSFDMMKAIAEYFRDLAQDDRYFGAEPPTPDAEMLARIAEREVSRRVEARQERGAIVLRPSPEAPEPVAEAPVPTPAPEPEAIEKAPEITAAPVVDTHQPEPEMIASETVTPDAPEASPAPSFDEDSIAAKLSRIRAVVSRSADAQPSETPTYSEDQHAEDFDDSSAASIAAALHSDTAAPEPFDAEEEDDLIGDFAVAAPAESEQDAQADTESDWDEPQDQSALYPGEDPQLAEDIAAAETTNEGDEPADDLADTPIEASEPAPQPLRARVIRMKRKDFEAAVADGALTAEDEADNQSLSPEAEAELLKELAAVEAELNLDLDIDDQNADETGSIFADDVEEEAPAAPQQPRPQRPAGAEATTDVSRLMDKAEEEMERPDGAHRRSAIAHLRAAVQATRAETEAGGGLNRGDDSLDAYRDDLNSVVRPRRPRPATASDQGETPRRPAQKPAPLKLVAEQRVDTVAPAPAPQQVVRPRRVMLTDVQDDPAPHPLTEGAASFTEFAEQAGVKNLSDLMEAAAAYMSYVEGRQKFSRPQLMNKARQVEEYQFSREDGLRSFGQLLRQGKIEKLKGGRFTVADDLIGFKPANRAAG